jgi:hypothetical protein
VESADWPRTSPPDCLDTLATADAAAGRFSAAIATAEKAVRLAAAGNVQLAKQIEGRLASYRSGRPCDEPADSAP